MAERQIKIKAWHIKEKKFVPISSIHSIIESIFTYQTYEGTKLLQHEVKLVISVHLKDKNGKDAFVGNIYKQTLATGEIRLYKIFQVKGGFAINQTMDDFYREPEKIQFYNGLSDMQTASFFEGALEEIGNSFENPELLVKPGTSEAIKS